MSWCAAGGSGSSQEGWSGAEPMSAGLISRGHPFLPKLIVCLREGYGRRRFLADLGAGLTVAVVALPLAMALGIASGLSPERGLYTAIVAGFLISALGGSRVQIGGPTGAFIVLVYGIVETHGYDGLAVATKKDFRCTLKRVGTVRKPGSKLLPTGEFHYRVRRGHPSIL